MIVLRMLQAVLAAAWDTFFLAAPFVLFGLLLAGLLHVLVSRRQLVRWMGGTGLAAAARAALLGVPLPLCSCGIVPVAISLRRQGASRPAVLSFLITTPESSADAVVLTWGLMGPLMALARLVAALASAMVAAVMAIAATVADSTAGSGPPREHREQDEPHHDPEGQDHGGDDAHHEHHDHADQAGGDEEAYVAFRALWAALAAPVRRFLRPLPAPGQPVAPGAAASSTAEPAVPLRRIVRAVGQRAFVELVDDI
ncbi:MAG: permease, partial [Acidobacteria bacterium]|nr:permease [Acidobacteriota bacterium]